MLTLSLWKKSFPQESFSFIGDKISDGADGEVFNLVSDSNKVIKISILYDLYFEGKEDLEFKYLKLSNIFDHLKLNKPTICAQLYDHIKIGSFTRPHSFNNSTAPQDYILHYYTMEKCYKLTEDEKKLFHTILSHEDRNLIKKFTPAKLQKILFELSRGLDFDIKKVIFFYESLMDSPINHNDLHPRNIMKDKLGSFKLIDFDRIQLEEK